MNLSRHAWMVSVALAACAAPTAHWEKSGASVAAANEDNEQCRARARLEAPQPYRWGSQGADSTRVLTLAEQRELNEIEYLQKCMRDKGYSAKR